MKKIMFNDRFLLTQAVLDRRKTMTRRIVPEIFFSLNWDTRILKNMELTLVYENENGDYVDVRESRYARYKAGEIVAIAQSYKEAGVHFEDIAKGADILSIRSRSKGVTNKMFVKSELMPHQIRITNVRVQRLQDITDEDCIKEGIEEIGMHDDYPGYIYYNDPVYRTDGYETPREAYASLIDRISGKGTWDSNPYVFVYDFELVR